MLSLEEKKKIKDILENGLNINRDINLTFFLKAISNTKDDVTAIKSAISDVESKLRLIDHKIDSVIAMIRRI